jgi:hypothetical protein
VLLFWVVLIGSGSRSRSIESKSVDERRFASSREKCPIAMATTNYFVAAKRKADDDLVMAFKEDTEVNKKLLALEVEKNHVISCAIHICIISDLRTERLVQREVVKNVKKELLKRIPDWNDQKKRIQSYTVNEDDTSQDSATSLLEEYIQERQCLSDIEKRLDIKEKKYDQLDKGATIDETNSCSHFPQCINH